MNEPQREVLFEEGVVLAALESEEGRPARVRVRLLAGDHCEGCPASGMCRPQHDDQRVLEVVDAVGVEVGDRVRVAVPGGAVLRASFLIYGLPLLLLLAGVALGHLIWPATDATRELWSFVLGAGLAAAAVPVVARLARDTEAAGGALLEPRVAEKLAAEAACNAGS